jgi:hypothetical protein
MPQQDNQRLAEDLVKSLGLQHPPLAISFTQETVPGVEPSQTPCRRRPRMGAPGVSRPAACSG